MNYRIIEGMDQIDISEVERLLKMTYWANHRSTDTIEKSMHNSSCFGIRSDEEQKLIGFALETQHEIENALHKMERKNLDAIVLNSLRDKGAGFGVDTNRVTISRADGNSLELPLLSKEEAANEIIRYSFLLEEAE